MKRVRVFLPLLLVPFVVLGCGGASIVQQGPSDALRGYAEALEQGRADDAYRMLSDDAKRGMSLEAFRRAVKENPQDALEIARAMARPSSDPILNATVTLPSGEELLLVYEGGHWRIDASVVDLYSQKTPRQAILGFLRAFENRRYDVILRYVPDADREGTRSAVNVASEPPPLPSLGAPAAPHTASSAAPPGPAPPAPPAAVPHIGTQLTADKIKAEWEGAEKEEMNRIVQAIKTALPMAQIEETGDSAAMPYGAGGSVAFVREHGLWKIRELAPANR